jgi:two-component system CheB/CheR fusion protein
MDAAAVFDDEWRLTAVNKRGCELSGYTQEELLGTLVFFHLIPDTSAEVHRLLQNRIPSSGLQFETYIRRKDGTGILSEIHIEALGGTQKGYQAIIRDISSRRRLEKSLLESTERERNKLGRELHDGLCQVLKSLEIDATLLKTEDHSKDNLIRRINEALRETYNYSKGLLPKELSIDDWELEFLRLGRLCRKDGSIQWNCRIDKNAIPRDSSVAHNLFRIAREAVINAERHSGTGRIDVALSMDAHGCFLAVKDYGLGIDPSLPPKEDSGLGMLAMKSRAEAIGAFITINSAPERGTEIICRSKTKHWGRNAE